MARTLTTPLERADGTQQAITRFNVEIPHARNNADDAMIIDKDNVAIKYEVLTFDDNGEIIGCKTTTVGFKGWPAGFKAELRAIYSKIHAHAESTGLIAGTGSDEALE